MGEAGDEVVSQASRAAPGKRSRLIQPRNMDGRPAENEDTPITGRQTTKFSNGNLHKRISNYQNGKAHLNGNVEQEINEYYNHEILGEEHKNSSLNYNGNISFNGSVATPPPYISEKISVADGQRNDARGPVFTTAGDASDNSSRRVRHIERPSLPSESTNEQESLLMEQLHVHDVYDQMAHHFADVRYKAWPGVKRFLQHLEPASLVADVGCGSGKYLRVNQDIIKFGSDRCHGLVDLARGQGHEVMVCDNLQLPYRDSCFDAVISIGVLHHLTTRRRRTRALWELARILRPGGKVMLYVWALEQHKRKFESQDVLVPWHFTPKEMTRQDPRKGHLVSTTSSVSEDEVFEEQSTPKLLNGDDHSLSQKGGHSFEHSLDSISWDEMMSVRCQGENALINGPTDLAGPTVPLVSNLGGGDHASQSPDAQHNGNSSPFTLSHKEGVDVGESLVQATGVSIILSCPHCGHARESKADNKTSPTLLSAAVALKSNHNQSVSEVIKKKFLSLFHRIAVDSASHTSGMNVKNADDDAGKQSRTCKHQCISESSGNSHKDTKYKELLDYIMREEVELLAVNHESQESSLATAALDGFAVRKFPQSSQVTQSDHVSALTEKVLSDSRNEDISDAVISNGNKLQMSQVCSIASDDGSPDQVFENGSELSVTEAQDSSNNKVGNISGIGAPVRHFGMRHTTSVGENLYDIADQCCTLSGMQLGASDLSSEIRDSDDLHCSEPQFVDRTCDDSIGVPSVSITATCDGISGHDDAKVASVCTSDISSFAPLFFPQDQSPVNSDAAQTAHALEVLNNIAEGSESTSSSNMSCEPVNDDDSDCGDWVATTTAAIKAIQEQVLLRAAGQRRGSVSPRHQSSCESQAPSFRTQHLESNSSDGYSTASDYDDGDSSDWSEQQDVINTLGQTHGNQDNDYFSSMNGVQEELCCVEYSHSDSQYAKDTRNLPDVTVTRGSSIESHNLTPDLVSSKNEKSGNEQKNSVNIPGNSEPDSSDTDNPTLQRYYHVFREGELDQLIEKYVTSLEIVESYYDHANWCIVAKKLPKLDESL